MTTRWSHVALGVLAACAARPVPTPPAPPGAAVRPATAAAPPAPPPVAWLDDLDELERHMGQHYANLDRGPAGPPLDLVALDRRTRTALRAARGQVEAIDALARFVGAFRDPHVAWSSPLPSTDYELRLTSDGTTVVVRTAGNNSCGLRPGDEIDTLEGKPALEQLALRLPLAGFGNEALRPDIALRTFTSSPFAPRDQLQLTVRRDGASVACTLRPRAPGASAEPAPVTPTTPGEAACARFGIAPGAPPALPFLFHPERHPALRPDAATSDLASGILHLASGRTLGWLRIPLFSSDGFPATCARAWLQYRARVERTCGDGCREDFVDRFLPRFLVDTIATRLRAFRRAGVSATVVDITDNGGGDDWTTDVARLVSPGPLVCPATAYVREPAAVERLDHERADQDTCAGLPLDGPARRALRAAQAWTAQVRDDAAQPCDLGGRFQGAPAGPRCSLLTRARRAPCDRWPAPPGVTNLPASCPVFQPRGSSPMRGVLGAAPVYVLINRRTGSAAELFAAVLRDNGAATLIGERTVGAGCGYVDGGSSIVLPRSGMTVRMPNCARFRADGSNELDGVSPDVSLPWGVDDLAQLDSYAEKLLVHAGALFPAQPPRRSR